MSSSFRQARFQQLGKFEAVHETFGLLAHTILGTLECICCSFKRIGIVHLQTLWIPSEIGEVAYWVLCDHICLQASGVDWVGCVGVWSLPGVDYGSIVRDVLGSAVLPLAV